MYTTNIVKSRKKRFILVRFTPIERSPVLALIETQTDLKVKFIDF
jgi:hypothetical protein